MAEGWSIEMKNQIIYMRHIIADNSKGKMQHRRDGGYLKGQQDRHAGRREGVQIKGKRRMRKKRIEKIRDSSLSNSSSPREDIDPKTRKQHPKMKS